MKAVLILFSIYIFTSSLFGVDATLKIKKDVEDRTRISLLDGSTSNNNKFFNILLSDLKISGHFLNDTNHNIGDFNSNSISANQKSREYVIKYNLNKSSGVKLSVKLINTSTNSVIFSKSYNMSSSSKLAFLAHKAIFDINKALNYPNIDWINRYVVYAVYTSSGRSEIRLSDYSFNYTKTLIRGGLNLFPKWADKNQRAIYYTSFRSGIPTLYKLNIYSGSKRKIVSSEGMLVCSDVSKNGSKLLLTMAPNGQPDIYEYRGGSKRRLTTFSGIDVNGRYINNDTAIAFVSNRLGYPNIFKKSLSSSSASQLVYKGRNNSAFDSYNNKIIYSARESNREFSSNSFNLYLTSTTSSGTRAITSRGVNQFPRFSSDGSIILYLKNSGGSSSIGYTNIISHQSVLFPFSGRKIQSIDW